MAVTKEEGHHESWSMDFQPLDKQPAYQSIKVRLQLLPGILSVLVRTNKKAHDLETKTKCLKCPFHLHIDKAHHPGYSKAIKMTAWKASQSDPL